MGRQPPDTVVIPTGEIKLAAGGGDARVDAFEIGRHPVTQGAYALFVHAHPDVPAPTSWPGGELPQAWLERPVVGVRFEDAARYAQWVGGALPTEAQWQLAACGPGGGWTYPWGVQPAEALGPTSWCAPNDLNALESVHAPSPESRSLYGLAALGAVWELTQTAHADGGAVLRGGPWRQGAPTQPSLINRMRARSAADDIGFRVALPLRKRAAQITHWPIARHSQEQRWLRARLGHPVTLRAYIDQQLTRLPGCARFELVKRDPLTYRLHADDAPHDDPGFTLTATPEAIEVEHSRLPKAAMPDWLKTRTVTRVRLSPLSRFKVDLCQCLAPLIARAPTQLS